MASAATSRPLISLPSFASFSSAASPHYSMAGPLAATNAPRSTSASSAAAAAMALSDLSSPRHSQVQGCTTPVFIPPLTPRGSNTPSQLHSSHSPNKLPPGSPVILDGRGLRSSRPDSPEDANRKRTASAAGIETGSNRRPSLNHGPSSYSSYRNVPSGSDSIGEPRSPVKQEPSASPPSRTSHLTINDQAEGERQESGSIQSKRRKVNLTINKAATPTSGKLTPVPLRSPNLLASGQVSASEAQPSPVSPIVMGFDAASALQDPNKAHQVRKSLSLMEQQKALIEARKSGGRTPVTATQPRVSIQGMDIDGDDEAHDANSSSLADRRGDKARSLKITTSAGRDTALAIQSAPIRPSGWQANAQMRTAVDHPILPPLYSAREMHGDERDRFHLPPMQVRDHRAFAGASRAPNFPDRRLSPILSAGGEPPYSASHSSHIPYPPHSAREPHPQHRDKASASKAAFLGLFDTFYDSLGDSRILQANLEDQIRRSSSLLGTLQQSSAVFESLLERRIAELVRTTTLDFQVLEGRIERLERAYESSGPSLPPMTPGLASLRDQQQAHGPGEGSLANGAHAVAHRLQKLERTLNEGQGTSRAAATSNLSTHATSNLRDSTTSNSNEKSQDN